MAKKKEETCAFCGRPGSSSEVLIPSGIQPGVYLCAECADQIHQLLADYRHQVGSGQSTGDLTGDSGAALDLAKLPNPKEICYFLDKSVIGQ